MELSLRSLLKDCFADLNLACTLKQGITALVTLMQTRRCFVSSNAGQSMTNEYHMARKVWKASRIPHILTCACATCFKPYRGTMIGCCCAVYVA